MKPIDYRNENWEQLQERLTGLRHLVYRAWKEHGPGTTREVSLRSGMDLLTFRPRTTELHQMGLVELVEPSAAADTSGEGTYQAVPIWDARMRHEALAAAARQEQLPLL